MPFGSYLLDSTANSAQFEWKWAGLAVLFSRYLPNGTHNFFQNFRICSFKDFIKNPQTTIALTFLAHIISGIDGVIRTVLTAGCWFFADGCTTLASSLSCLSLVSAKVKWLKSMMMAPDSPTALLAMVIWVVKFPRKVYKIKNTFGQKSTHSKKSMCLWIDVAGRWQKVPKLDFQCQWVPFSFSFSFIRGP